MKNFPDLYGGTRGSRAELHSSPVTTGFEIVCQTQMMSCAVFY